MDLVTTGESGKILMKADTKDCVGEKETTYFRKPYGSYYTRR